MLRVQLINNVIGSKVLEVTDPIDINNIIQTYKRSEEHAGVIFEVIFDLQFTKEGRQFIWQAYEQDAGIDTITIVNLYELNPNATKKWNLVATGQVNYNKFDLGEHDVVVNIEQTGLERRVLNMLEIDVNLETVESENGTALPAQVVHNIPFHSKKLLLQFRGEGTQEEFDFQSEGSGGGDNDTYIQFPLNATFDEINERQDYPLGPSEFVPMDIVKYNWRVDTAGVYKINIPQLTMNAFSDGVGNDPNFGYRFDFKIVYGKKNNYTTVVVYTGIKAETDVFDVNIAYNTTINLDAGDEIYMYWQSSASFAINIHFRIYTFDGPLILKNIVELDAETLFPETEVRTILLYEAIERCLMYYTNQSANIFRSTLLGRIDIGYAADGEFSLIGITNGHRLRQKNSTLPIGQRGDTVFANLEDLIQFVKVIACADFGFELDENGNKIFVLEKKEYFYNKNLKSISLGRVYDVRRRVNPKRFYNQVEIGYTAAVDVQQYNAVDEFNTRRKFQIPIINTKNSLVLLTEMITSGYLIESQRRLELTTEDGKYDDRNFAVVLLRDGLNYKTKKNEGYDAITNVLFPDTGYNYDLSPARILPNWFKVIGSSLIRSKSKTLKFTYGEVNYIMTTLKTGELEVTAENGNFTITVEPIWDNEDYNFNHKISRDEIQLIRNNLYGYIEFTDKDDNVMEGFISPEGGIQYDNNSQTAEFNLLKVHRP